MDSKYSAVGVYAPAPRSTTLQTPVDYASTRQCAWAKLLRVGDSVDALDTVHVWREARVVAVTPTHVLVHFCGWAPRFDEWVPFVSMRLATAYSRILNWRAALAVGHHVQIVRPADQEEGNWCDGTVVRTSTLLGRVRVLVEIDGIKEKLWVDAQSDTLAAPGTHKKITDETPNARDVEKAQPRPASPVAVTTKKVDVHLETLLQELMDEWQRHILRLELFGDERSKYWSHHLEFVRTETMKNLINYTRTKVPTPASRALQLSIATLEVKKIVDTIERSKDSELIAFRAKCVRAALETMVKLCQSADEPIDDTASEDRDANRKRQRT